MPVSRESILEELQKLLTSTLFENAGRSSTLIKYLVQETVDDRADRLKEYTIGAEALGRGDAFDPRTDPIVRAEASRLRGRLERYYAAEGRADPITIMLPKGSYVPQFLERSCHEGDAEIPATSRWPIWLALGTFGALCLMGLGIWAWPRSQRQADASMVQFDVELKTKGAVGSEVGTDVVISPDGARIVFVSRTADGNTHLNARSLSQPEAVELPETEGARGPFFSPDGRWVGFWAGGRLQKIPVDGGSPVALCEAPDLLGSSWSDHRFIIASFGGTALMRISAAGGTPTVVADFKSESILPVWPQLLPGGKSILFTGLGVAGPNGAAIYTLTMVTGEVKEVVRGGTYGRYLPGGYVTYVNQGTLFALPFDLEILQPLGAPVPVLEKVAYSSTFGFAQLDFSETSTVVYRKNSGGQMRIQWLDSAGRTEPLLAKPGVYLWPRLSPDGERLAVSVTEGGVSNVTIYDRKLDRLTPLATAGRTLSLWTPDGRALILGGPNGLAWLQPDSAKAPELLTKSGNIQVPWSFAPGGRRLAYHERNPATGFDLWTVPIKTTGGVLSAGKPEPFLRTPAYETYPAFSPDGNWIAYGSNESIGWEVYVRAFPDNGSKVKVSIAGGRIAAWSGEGHELLYRTDDQKIMAATCSIKGGSFVVDSVRQWTPARLAETGVLANFDLAADGKRIVALVPSGKPEDQQSENHVTFMLNFIAEIERRVPVPGRVIFRRR